MPSINGQGVSIAANSVSGNVLSGELFEFLPGQASITLLAVAAAAGIRVTFTLGGQVLINDQPISAANRFPITPDDILTVIGGFQGERLFLEFRNTTGGAVTVDYAVKID